MRSWWCWWMIWKVLIQLKLRTRSINSPAPVQECTWPRTEWDVHVLSLPDGQAFPRCSLCASWGWDALGLSSWACQLPGKIGSDLQLSLASKVRILVHTHFLFMLSSFLALCFSFLNTVWRCQPEGADRSLSVQMSLPDIGWKWSCRKQGDLLYGSGVPNTCLLYFVLVWVSYTRGSRKDPEGEEVSVNHSL